MVMPTAGLENPRMARIRSTESAIPTPVPAPMRTATSRATFQTTCWLRAPSAMRMPISRDRRETANAKVPCDIDHWSATSVPCLGLRGRSSMKRLALMWIVLTGALLVPTTSSAQISCSREGLQHTVDLYIAAQTRGDTSGLPLAAGLGYMENLANADINKGLIRTPMKIDHHRSLLDPATCQTFTEVIVTDKERPYVLGTRLRVNHDKIAEIEILWTTTGYWLFNADAYLKYSSSEKWDTIPANQRDTRDTLVSAANAYLDAFLEGKKDMVPWGYPCNRTEGGAHTGNGSPTDSCDVGVPSGV